MTTSIAANLRQLAAAAKRASAKAAEAKEKKEADQKKRKEEDNRRIDAQIKADIATVYEKDFAPKIEEVANKGENKVTVKIGESYDYQFVQDPLTKFSQRERSIYAYLPAYLEQQGCTVRTELQKDYYEFRDAIKDEMSADEAHNLYRLVLHIEW